MGKVKALPILKTNKMEEKKLYSKALLIAQFVIIYNGLEGIISILLGIKEESLTFAGFGVGSLVEVASNLGVIYMIKRIRENPKTCKSDYENRALKITGWGFYLLSASLLFGIIVNIIQHHKPENTLFGVLISLISITIMLLVAYNQLKIGKKLNSQPIISDAKCALVCVYMSIVLLVASAVYYLTGFAYADILGAIGLIYFSVKEGKECLEKANGKETCKC